SSSRRATSTTRCSSGSGGRATRRGSDSCGSPSSYGRTARRRRRWPRRRGGGRRVSGAGMRLVYASGSRVPSRSANSVHVMKMSAALSRTGHEVTLIAADGDPGEPGVADPFSYYGVSPTFEVLRLPWIGVRGRGYHYGWRSAREARRRAPALVYGRYLPSCWLGAEAGLPVASESHSPK